MQLITYNPLPRIDNILLLAKLARPFPTDVETVQYIAEVWDFNQSTRNFLSLLPSDVVFKNEDDFFGRCDELTLFMRSERSMPIEMLHSPQG
ncbi:MAG: hypothetical protein WC498_00945 [Candidatus Saccharimonadales bacterium]